MASLETADVFRQFGPSYLEAFGHGMLPSHRRAMADIVACRTAAMGGHMFRCNGCGQHFYVYHGCRNRSCPACHTAQTRQWLQARSEEILPCPYYHLTVTVPRGLRAAFRSNQRDCYSLFMKAATQAVLALCADVRYLGGLPAILSVLHTWTAEMHYHPHVHLLVSGGGVTPDGASWREANHPFLIPVRALSRLVRGTFMALLKRARPDLAAAIAPSAWNHEWVAWCKPWGKGETAVLEYLARYVHRIAITNRRILAMDGTTVTFRYKDRKANTTCDCTVDGHEFIRRFLQHVLPKGFHKVRYAGLWHSSRRQQRQQLRALMLVQQAQATPSEKPPEEPPMAPSPPSGQDGTPPTSHPPCPHCGCPGTTHLRMVYRSPSPCPARASP